MPESLYLQAMRIFAMQILVGDNQTCSLWRQVLGKLNLNAKGET